MTRLKTLYFLLFAVIFFFGVSVRISAYIQQPALWHDETYTAIHLMHLPFIMFIYPDTNSSNEVMRPYPLGFLSLNKIITLLWGFSELTLRLLTFLAGIISLLLFRRLADSLFKPPWNLAALGFFAACYPVIYHTIQLKPYAMDILVVLIVYLRALNEQQNTSQSPSVIRCTLEGVAVMLFSFPALIIMFTLIAFGMFEKMLQKQWAAVQRYVIMGGTILSVFAAYMLISIRHIFENQHFMTHWQPVFASFHGGLTTALMSILKTFQTIFLWWGIPNICAALLILLGAITLLRKNRLAFIFFLIPIVVTIAASIMGIYPFILRASLFLIPSLIIVMTYGLQSLKIPRYRYASVVLSVIVTIFILATAVNKASAFYRPFSFGEDVRPLMNFFAANFKKGDGIYVNNFGNSTYAFYNQVIRGKNNPVDYHGVIGDIVIDAVYKNEPVRGIIFYNYPSQPDYLITEKKTLIARPGSPPFPLTPGWHWFILTHTREDGRKILIDYLDTIGDRVFFRQSDKNAFLYCYDIPMPLQ